jgi:predicted AAA+ superfamily ATPase
MQRLIFGSYPEAYITDDPARYLTNLSSDYLLKDIFTSSLVRSPQDVRRLLLELAQEIGNIVSVAALATRLKISRQTVQKYLELLENIFVIFSVPAYATNPLTEINKSRKYYFWDNGVKNALQREWVVSESRSDIKTLWENWVVAEIFKLSRTLNRHEELFFWQSRNGSTVDLVVKQGKTLFPFNICFNPHNATPCRSFTTSYNAQLQHITPENILEILA